MVRSLGVPLFACLLTPRLQRRYVEVRTAQGFMLDQYRREFAEFNIACTGALPFSIRIQGGLAITDRE
jgi:hypothetical protein